MAKNIGRTRRAGADRGARVAFTDAIAVAQVHKILHAMTQLNAIASKSQ
jgi:hypothetical protein